MDLTSSENAKELNALHRELVRDSKDALDKFMHIGSRLCKTKEAVGHGKWQKYVEDKLEYPMRTVNDYMRCFQNRVLVRREHIESLRDLHRLLSLPLPKNLNFTQQTDQIGSSAADLKQIVPHGENDLQMRQTEASGRQILPGVSREEDEGVEGDKPGGATVGFGSLSGRFGERCEVTQIKDELGRVIPDGILPLWNRSQEVQDLMTLASKLRSALRNAQGASDALFSEVNYSDCISRLDTVYYALRCCIPYTLCPYCHGQAAKKSCKFCKTRGYISEMTWKGPIPPEVKRAAEKQGRATA